MRFRFVKTALVLTLIMAALLAYPVLVWMAPAMVRAVAAAGIISLVNVVLGAAIIEWSFDKSNGIFLSSTFGGMALRMMLVLVTFAILVINGYDRMALTFALMGFHLVFMIAEVTYITRDLARRKQRSHRDARASYRRHVSSRIASADHRST